MSMNNDLHASEEANRTYFISLANSRASLRYLPLMSLLTFVLVGFASFILVSTIFFEGDQRLLPLLVVHIGIMAFAVLVLLASLGQIRFRFQVIASSLMTLFAVVWVYALCFGAISIAASVQTPLNTTYNFSLLPILMLLGGLYVFVAFGVHVLLLRRRLRDGHSAQRTLGNLISGSSVYRAKSFWIILGVTVIGSNLITRGQHVTLTFGVLLFFLFASVLTSIPVEFGYLSFLKSRDKSYWERAPHKIRTTRADRSIGLKRAAKWALIALAVILGIAVLNELLPKIWA